MGDRTWWTEKCPKCKKQTLDCYDAPSCLQWSASCNNCNYRDPRDYYETEKNVIELLTKDEARKRKIIEDCPTCGDIMTWWMKEEYGVCISCQNDDSYERAKILQDRN